MERRRVKFEGGMGNIEEMVTRKAASEILDKVFGKREAAGTVGSSFGKRA